MIKKFIKIELLVLVLLLINITLMLNFGFTFGVFMVFMASAAVLIWLLLKRYSSKSDSKLVGAAYKIVTIGIIAWVISFVAIVSVVVTTVNYDVDDKEYDYIIVLGAGLWGDRISLILEKRLEKAVELSTQMPDAKIIVSGGQGEDELISEAEAMRRYLVKHQVDENRIILEDQSTNTAENFYYSKQVLDEVIRLNEVRDEGATVLVITSDFHLFRSLRLAERKGLTVDGVASRTPKSVYLNYMAREYFAVIKSEVFD